MKKVLLILFLMFITTSVYAQDIPMSWDKVEDAISYVVYWRDKTGENEGNSGPVIGTKYIVKGLPGKIEFFFTVKAFNHCGNSSDHSNKISSCDIKAPVEIPLLLKFDTTIIVKVEISNDFESPVKSVD